MGIENEIAKIECKGWIQHCQRPKERSNNPPDHRGKVTQKSIKKHCQSRSSSRKRQERQWGEDVIKDILEEKRLHLEMTHLVQSILNIQTNSKHPGDISDIGGGEELIDTSQVPFSVSFFPVFSFSTECRKWGCFPGPGLQLPSSSLQKSRSPLCDST